MSSWSKDDSGYATSLNKGCNDSRFKHARISVAVRVKCRRGFRKAPLATGYNEQLVNALGGAVSNQVGEKFASLLESLRNAADKAARLVQDPPPGFAPGTPLR
jgi:hypothetical protein